MQQWWDALGQLYAMLQDSEALGLSREARRRLIVAIGALDNALLNCATADCPIRSTVQDTQAAGESATATAGRHRSSDDLRHAEWVAAGQTCSTCRWWSRHRPCPETREGVCLLTKTASGGDAGQSRADGANSLARAASNDPLVGAVLLTQVPYACSQWAPL